MYYSAMLWKLHGKLAVATPKNPHFAKDFHRQIPARYRKRNEAVGCWVVHPMWYRVVLDLANHHFIKVTDNTDGFEGVEQKEADRHVPITVESTSYRSMLCVTDDAPPEVVTAAWKALNKLYHPDRGGDEAKMQKINEAYQQIKEAWK